jgi:hypothetical protein
MTSLRPCGYAQNGAGMETLTQMAAAFEKQLIPEILRPDWRPSEGEDHPLEISVVATSPDTVSTALERAAGLAGSLSARITVIVPQIVPFPLPLSTPPVLLDFQESRLRQIASKSPVETVVRIYLCRDPWEVLKTVLMPHSLIVLASRRRWRLLRRENRLARRLRKAGHEVIMADSE